MILKAVKITIEDAHPVWNIYVAFETMKKRQWVPICYVHRESDVFKLVDKNCAILDSDIETVDITNGSYDPNDGYKSFFLED